MNAPIKTHTDTQWGYAGIAIGSMSPLGIITNITHRAPGISYFDAQRGSGYKLSSSRNEAVPKALRCIGGFYVPGFERAIIHSTFASELHLPSSIIASAQSLVSVYLENISTAPPPEAPCFRLDLRRLSPAQRDVARKDWQRKIRRPDGSSKTLRIMIETEGVTSKCSNGGHERKNYLLVFHDANGRQERIEVTFSLWKSVSLTAQ